MRYESAKKFYLHSKGFVIYLSLRQENEQYTKVINVLSDFMCKILIRTRKLLCNL